MISEIFHHITSLFVEFFQKEESWLILILIAVAGAGGVVAAPGFAVMPVLVEIVRFLVLTWWLWVFFLLVPLATGVWKHWRQEMFKSQIKWILLELKMPREVTKSPRAMEQVLQGFHTLRNAAGDIRESMWEGEVTVWFSLEIASFGGQIRFFVRGQKKQKNLIEAAIFSYYPDLEVHEVEDYVNQLPATTPEMYERGMNMWGTEMLLAKEDAYPIKTYKTFESEAEDKTFDPISSFLEVLGKVSPNEIVGIQMLIAPADRDWTKRFSGMLDELRTPKTMKIGSGDDTRELTVTRTPGQVNVLEAVEENLSKPAFETLIRFIYMAPQDTYYDTFARRGLVGAFNQYGALDLNGFKSNQMAATRAQIWNWPHIYSGKRVEYRKQRLLWNYRRREVPPETPIGRLITSYLFNWNFASRRFHMNTEGLATLFHPPTAGVLTAPHIERVESKKAGPPAGLAIFGEEGEIERYV